MKVKILVLAIALLIAGGSFGAVGTNLSVENENTVLGDGEYIPGEVVIGFHTQVEDLDPVDVRTIDSFEDRNIIQKIEELNVAVVEVNDGEELDFIDSISNSPLVEFAELNFAGAIAGNSNNMRANFSSSAALAYRRIPVDRKDG